MAVYTIDFEPLGRRGECQSTESLLACARQFGIGINNICGGQGTCYACKIRIIRGMVTTPTANELEVFSPQELRDGWRLACQAYPINNLTLSVPVESMTTPQRTQVEGLETAVPPEPPVQVYPLQLPAPSSSNPQADADSILKALQQQYGLTVSKIDLSALRTLPLQLRSWNWQCQAITRNGEVIAISPWHSPQLGLAIDLGTTKIAGYLVDLNNGLTLAAKGVMNPQISYGEDIISRINSIINSPGEGARLQQLVVQAINELTDELCAYAGANVEEIVEAAVVGNTAMHHIFLGLPVSQLAISPFIPVISQPLDIKARDLGLRISPGAYAHLLPNIAGFVGADHVAMLLVSKHWQNEGPLLAMDIGTNTEVSLINNGQITTVSCASGPAFEGGHIKDGMRAASGAMERVRITSDNVSYQTIDDVPPIGICGSGILDAMAQLYLAGIINQDGRMQDNRPRVRSGKKQREFVLVSKKERGGLPAIVITQQDIRELQLAKAAIRTGIQILLEANGCSEEEIRQVIIAGAFGSYIDVSSAITIGMLPALPLECFRQIGNAAGLGAKLALISLSQRTEAQNIASRAHYIELASAPDFMPTFIQASKIGQYRITHGKRV